jgi:hypothetical protein
MITIERKVHFGHGPRSRKELRDGEAKAVTYSGGKIADIAVRLPFVLTAGTTLYGQAVVRNTPTYGATSDLIFKFTIAKD